MGGRHTRVPVPLQASIIPPLRSYHKPPYVKNLSFCVRASATSYYNLVIVEPTPSETPPPKSGPALLLPLPAVLDRLERGNGQKCVLRLAYPVRVWASIGAQSGVI